MKAHGPSASYGSFSFVIVPKIPRSFGIIIKPFKNLLRAFQSQRGLNHTNHGGAAEGRPPSLLSFYWLWLLKALTRLLKGFITVPNDQPHLCTLTNEKVPIIQDSRPAWPGVAKHDPLQRRHSRSSDCARTCNGNREENLVQQWPRWCHTDGDA